VADLDLVKRLGDVLEAQRPGFDVLDSYIANRPAGPLGFIAPEVREQVGSRLKPVTINYPRLVVAAIEERLQIDGFRLGDGDGGLWQLWRENGLDLDAALAHFDALTYGRAPVLVWSAGEPGSVRITVESARQVAVAYDAASREPQAAVKLWLEPAAVGDDAQQGYARAVLFLPDEIVRLRSKARVADVGSVPVATGWNVEETIPNPLGVVPVVELTNRSRVLGGGESELVDVLPIVDALDKLATDMMVSAEFAAMPRRYVTGMALPERPNEETGEPEPDTAAAFNLTAMRTWFIEDEQVKVGQFPEAGLEGFVRGIETLTQQLASVSALPAHYLNNLTGQLPSAESLRSAEASLVAKVRRKMQSFGAGWGRVARLALLVRDGTLPAGADGLEVVWRDPESRTDAMAADAALKRAQLGIPLPTLWADLGYTPAQVADMQRQRATDAIVSQGVDLTLLQRAAQADGNAA
jgi:hypothetical protein